MYEALLVIFLIVAIALVGLIMLQQGKGADMGASFGAGASGTLFGSSGSGNFMTRMTGILAALLGKGDLPLIVPLVVAMLAGLAVGHAFIPPTPGPVLVASMLGVDLGWVILIGIFCGIFAMIAAGPIWGSICGKKYMIEVPEHVAQQADIDESKLPKFGTIVGIIMIPLLLIIANSVAKVVPALAGIQPVLAFLGEPFMALLLATIAATYLLGTRHG